MSLRSRIVLTIAIVFACVTLATSWFGLTRAEASLRNAFVRTMQTRANWLLSLVGIDPVIVPLPSENERMKVVYRAYGQQRELFRSPGFSTEAQNDTSSTTYRTVTVHTTGNQLANGQILLTLSMPDHSLREDIKLLRWVFGLGWLVSIGLSFLGGYVVAGELLKPIQRIVSQANEINDARSVDTIPLPESHDELYQLTDTLNRMLVRIRESIELQRNFFGAAAHELRTPLAIMKTGLEVTLTNTDGQGEMNQFLAGQLDEVSRLTRLLDEFLTLSRPDEGLSLLKPVEICMPQFIRQCIERLQAMAMEYEVTVDVVTHENELDATKPVLIDANKLEHILLNLLENAIKYAVSGSQVRVQCSQNDTYTIQIQNHTRQENGPVLDLAQPYFRADPLREGYGLGLWISHRLTNMIGGTLQLSWQQSVFTSRLLLPINNA